jgi:hypothetical protein
MIYFVVLIERNGLFNNAHFILHSLSIDKNLWIIRTNNKMNVA